MSKIFKKHLYSQIESFVEEFGIIPDCQSGFRKNFSTTTTLDDVLNDVKENKERKQSTCITLLDFSKAFDTVNHEMLLAKLHYFGFSHGAVSLIKNILKQRSPCVLTNTQMGIGKPSFQILKKGVPQGSIISPLLFAIYVVDMNDCVRFCRLKQFADDSQLEIPINRRNIIGVKDNLIR